MASLHTRKLLKLGHSIAVCLPPGWLAWKGLKQGDKVIIVTNGKLTIEAGPESRCLPNPDDPEAGSGTR
jgi:hypothetical protein